MEEQWASTKASICNVWRRLKLYMQRSWTKQDERVKGRQLIIEEAHEQMTTDYGNNIEIWSLERTHLALTLSFPKPT
jgi:hypothetical protein